MAGTRKPVVEVRRSQRRRRTVSAYRDGERVVVLIPDQFSRAEESEWVDRMLARLAAREGRLARSDAELLARAARLVDLYARRPQVQERITAQVADALVKKMDPQGVIVVIDAEHLCMAMRGIRKPGSRTTTSAVRGLFQTSASSRAEAMALIRQK